jgi:2'-5' RNA ligase
MDDDPYSPAVSRLAEHWQWRPDWLQDRACLWWYLTFEDGPAVRELARRVQAVLGRAPQLDLVPLPWLHLTLLEVGFADEVPAETVDRVVRAAHEGLADFPAVDLDLATVRAMPGALVLEADGRRLRSLHERLTDSVLRVRGAEGVGALRGFVPHVSVAYVNRDCAAQEVLGPLDGVDVSTPSPSATVRRVRLAAVTRQRRHYQWTTRAVVPLGAARGHALVSATRREGGR